MVAAAEEGAEDEQAAAAGIRDEPADDDEEEEEEDEEGSAAPSRQTSCEMSGSSLCVGSERSSSSASGRPAPYSNQSPTIAKSDVWSCSSPERAHAACCRRALAASARRRSCRRAHACWCFSISPCSSEI